MYLTTEQIARSRMDALNNLFSLYTACFDAGLQLNGLLAAVGRETIEHGSRQLSETAAIESGGLPFPTALWHEGRARSSRLFDEACEVIGQTQRAMIRVAEAQFRSLDELTLTGIRRATRTSPWEIAIGLSVLHRTVENADESVHDISVAALEALDHSEAQAHRLSERLSEESTS